MNLTEKISMTLLCVLSLGTFLMAEPRPENGVTPGKWGLKRDLGHKTIKGKSSGKRRGYGMAGNTQNESPRGKMITGDMSIKLGGKHEFSFNHHAKVKKQRLDKKKGKWGKNSGYLKNNIMHWKKISTVPSFSPSAESSSGASLPTSKPPSSTPPLSSSAPTTTVNPVASTNKPSNAPTHQSLVICNIFQSYFASAKMNHTANDVTDWNAACNDVDTFDEQVCPTGIELDNICQNPDTDSSIRSEFCEPYFLPMSYDSTLHEFCVEACLRYVSKTNGDCCSLECDLMA